MKHHLARIPSRPLALLALALALPAHGAGTVAPSAAGERVRVTIYEFRSQLPTLASTTAVDMFTTALVRTGRFRVVERARLDDGVVREKRLQQSGWANGDAAQRQLDGAQYVFEGVVSEANVAEKTRSGGLGVAGLRVGGGSSRDSIVIDVRIVDAATGEVVDAVTARKPIVASSSSVGGVGALLGGILARKGVDTTYAPDVQAQSETRGGLDAALHAAIDDAVGQIASRFGR